jgi:hypothetical protein
MHRSLKSDSFARNHDAALDSLVIPLLVVYMDAPTAMQEG